MNEKDQYDLFMKQVQQNIQTMEYPHPIDVVDSVMNQINDPKFHQSKRRNIFSIKKIVASIAACAAICLLINITILYSRSYDDAQLGTMMAEVYDYNHAYGDNDTTLYVSDEIMNYYITH